MTAFLIISFFVFGALAIYSYVLYPIVLRFLPNRERPIDAATTSECPSMSIIVAAHNEQCRIGAKIDNLLALDPYDGFTEIIVVSDASTDETDDIVKSYSNQGVRLVRNPNREGKEAAQALAIAEARGEILVFTDTSTSIDRTAMNKIAPYFLCDSVGAISSTDKFVTKDGSPVGEGIYVRYEMKLRALESKVGSLVGLSGSFFAARASVCQSRWATDVPSDFLTAINCRLEGLDAILAEDVIGYYADLSDSRKEFERKVRTVLRGMNAVKARASILNVRRFGLFSFQVWSHKILRWFVPWALLGVLVSNLLILSTSQWFILTLIPQAFLYVLALLGHVSERLVEYSLVRVAYFFVMANMAIVIATGDFIRGQRSTVWTPSKR